MNQTNVTDSALRDATLKILEENYSLSLNQIYTKICSIFNVEKLTSQQKDLIKAERTLFLKTELRYSVKKGKTEISEFSKPLEKIVNEKSLQCKGCLVLLTEENSKIIEKAIKNDDDYFPFSEKIFKYYKKKVGTRGIKKNKEKSLFAIIREIDRDNNTNAWRYGNKQDFHKIIDYITKKKNRFFSKLKKGDTSLPDELTNLTKSNNKQNSGMKSLSSKICKYLSEFFYKKSPYYINDSVVRHAVLFYYHYYVGVHKKYQSSAKIETISYAEIHELLNTIKTTAQKEHGGRVLTNSEIDHIIWYCYKSYKT